MSRSFRKHPFYSGGSNKRSKQYASRLLRHKTKKVMETITVDIIWQDQEGFHSEPRRPGCPVMVKAKDDFLLPKADEVYDFWWNNDSGCSFDPEKYPYLLRK